jgi:hypothetical protein
MKNSYNVVAFAVSKIDTPYDHFAAPDAVGDGRQEHGARHHSGQRKAEYPAEPIVRNHQFGGDRSTDDGHRCDIESIQHVEKQAKTNYQDLLTADAAVVDDLRYKAFTA